jgi:hypothetical protein
MVIVEGTRVEFVQYNRVEFPLGVDCAPITSAHSPCIHLGLCSIGIRSIVTGARLRCCD